MHFTWPLRWHSRNSMNSGVSNDIPVFNRSSIDTHLDCFNLQRTLKNLRQVYDENNAALQRVYKQVPVIQTTYEAHPCPAFMEQASVAVSELRELQKKERSMSKALKRTERRYMREFRKLSAIEVTKVEADLSVKAQGVANAEAASLAKDVEIDIARSTIANLEAQVVEKDTHINRLNGQHQTPRHSRSEQSPALSARRLCAWKEACRALFQRLRQAQDQVSTLQSRLRLAEKEEEALDVEIDHLEDVVEQVVKYLAKNEKLRAVKFVDGQEGAVDCIWEESLEVPIYLDIR